MPPVLGPAPPPPPLAVGVGVAATVGVEVGVALGLGLGVGVGGRGVAVGPGFGVAVGPGFGVAVGGPGVDVITTTTVRGTAVGVGVLVELPPKTCGCVAKKAASRIPTIRITRDTGRIHFRFGLGSGATVVVVLISPVSYRMAPVAQGEPGQSSKLNV